VALDKRKAAEILTPLSVLVLFGVLSGNACFSADGVMDGKVKFDQMPRVLSGLSV
jgi:hypothetical protein